MNDLISNLIPRGHILIKQNIINKQNIIGVGKDKSAWASEVSIDYNGDYTFFAGCGYQFMKYAEALTGLSSCMEKIGIGIDKSIYANNMLSKVGIDVTNIAGSAIKFRADPYKKTLIKSVRILQSLGVSINYMFQNEPCCGSPLYYAGFLDEYRQNAERAFNEFKSNNVRKLIGIIPACVESLKNIYPKYIDGWDIEVFHFLQIVAERIDERGIKLEFNGNPIITYHDPCQLSRYLKIIEEPRKIINSIKNVEFREVGDDKSKKWSTCCGGGGMEAGNPALAERLGLRRVEELLSTGADIIVTQCPACIMQLRRAAKKLKSNVKIVDLIDLIYDCSQIT